MHTGKISQTSEGNKDLNIANPACEACFWTKIPWKRMAG